MVEHALPTLDHLNTYLKEAVFMSAADQKYSWSYEAAAPLALHLFDLVLNLSPESDLRDESEKEIKESLAKKIESLDYRERKFFNFLLRVYMSHGRNTTFTQAEIYMFGRVIDHSKNALRSRSVVLPQDDGSFLLQSKKDSLSEGRKLDPVKLVVRKDAYLEVSKRVMPWCMLLESFGGVVVVVEE